MWGSTQSSIAASSGEAERHALVRGAAESLLLAAAVRESGWELKVQVLVGSSVAKAFLGRVGRGCVRHIEVRPLRRITKKINDFNACDALTKPKPLFRV